MDLRERPSTPTTRHPWETVRARFFTRVLVGAGVAERAMRVLDIGAGDGFVAATLLDALPEGSSVTCFDSEYADTHLAALRRAAPAGVRFTRECPDEEFDAIVLLDVLEHVADDRAFLRDIVTPRLRAGGKLLVSVPAHRALFTQHDVALGHQRRYSIGELRDVVEAEGFVASRSGSLFGSLLVPRALEKAFERVRGIRSEPTTAAPAEQISTGVTAWRHGRWVTSAVTGALELDGRVCELAARYSAPTAGLSVWALCEQRGAASR